MWLLRMVELSAYGGVLLYRVLSSSSTVPTCITVTYNTNKTSFPASLPLSKRGSWNVSCVPFLLLLLLLDLLLLPLLLRLYLARNAMERERERERKGGKVEEEEDEASTVGGQWTHLMDMALRACREGEKKKKKKKKKPFPLQAAHVLLY